MKEDEDTAHEYVRVADVITFFRQGWKVLAALTIVGGVIGVALNEILSEVYRADAVIRPANVSGFPLEDVNIVLERLKSPTFYSARTRSLCEGGRGEGVAKRLDASVARDSELIAVSFQSSSAKRSTECLEAVLSDIRLNQAALVEVHQSNVRDRLSALRSSLDYIDNRNRTYIRINQEYLATVTRNIAAARKSLEQMKSALAVTPLDAKNSLESALTSSLLFDKQARIQEMEHTARSVQSSLELTMSNQGENIFPLQEKSAAALRAEINVLERSVRAPSTVEATFLTPIYSPERPIQPRRMVTMTLGSMAGLLLGLGLALARRSIGRWTAAAASSRSGPEP